jgi:hypothetical protein
LEIKKICFSPPEIFLFSHPNDSTKMTSAIRRTSTGTAASCYGIRFKLLPRLALLLLILITIFILANYDFKNSASSLIPSSSSSSESSILSSALETMGWANGGGFEDDDYDGDNNDTESEQSDGTIL